MVVVIAFCSTAVAITCRLQFRRPAFVPPASPTLAGAEGFEPPSPVLETGSLTVELTLLNSVPDPQAAIGPECHRPARKYPITTLLHFFMWRVLAAPVAKLLQFQPVRRGLAIFCLRVIPFFTLATLHRNNLSRHCSLHSNPGSYHPSFFAWLTARCRL